MALVFAAHSAAAAAQPASSTGRRPVSADEQARREAWGREWSQVARDAAAAARGDGAGS